MAKINPKELKVFEAKINKLLFIYQATQKSELEDYLTITRKDFIVLLSDIKKLIEGIK